MTFREMLRVSFKSDDTEEWLDVWFTRPIGLVFALLWNKLGIHPNVITIVSFFLGGAAGWMFHYTDLLHNLYGVILLMLANFCDSTDGQMARLSGKKTLLGRVLDGFSGDVWFFCIYVAIAVRLCHQPIPGTTIEWGIWGFLLAAVAGFLSHAPQSSLADYYRQVHLYFLKGEAGSELNSYAAEKKTYEGLPRQGAFWSRVFHYFYMGWCKKQEKNTPAFQRFFARVKERYPNAADMPADFREEVRRRSLPLMWMTNVLTHNTRATVLYIACLANLPWVWPVFEVTVLAALYYYMKYRHETFCREMLADGRWLRDDILKDDE
jgi:phosphatidylserine synthase